MPLADPVKRAEYNKTYLKQHYQRNKDYYYQRNKRNRLLKVQWIDAIKESTACFDCGNKFPACVMDFDHKEQKEFDISAAVRARGLSIGRILREIEKCDLVCANCHRIRTNKRLHSGVV